MQRRNFLKKLTLLAPLPFLTFKESKTEADISGKNKNLFCKSPLIEVDREFIYSKRLENGRYITLSHVNFKEIMSLEDLKKIRTGMKNFKKYSNPDSVRMEIYAYKGFKIRTAYNYYDPTEFICLTDTLKNVLD